MVENSEKNNLHPLAVGHYKRSYILLSEKITAKERNLVVITSRDGFDFSGQSKKIILKNLKGETEDLSLCHDYCLSGEGEDLVLTYLRDEKSGTKLVFAATNDLKTFLAGGVVSGIDSRGAFIPASGEGEVDVVYSGGKYLKISLSDNLQTWETKELQGVPETKFFEDKKSSVLAAWTVDKKVAVLWGADVTVDILADVNLSDQKIGEQKYFKIGAALFDRSLPDELVHQTQLPLFEIPVSDEGELKMIGLASGGPDNWRLYFAQSSGAIGFLDLSETLLFDQLRHTPVRLSKHASNPILEPSNYDWERGGTFNPAAVYLGGRVHLLYRAVGNDGYSCIGYASSADGVHIDERLSYPCYIPRAPFEGGAVSGHGFDAGLFASGGSWGGCEDPKLTLIDDRLYMTYVAHNGYWPMRTALTSISVDDFIHHRFNWSPPAIMSPAGVGSKSVVILPEKINDRYIIFHRLWPSIIIDQVPDLSFGEDRRWLASKFKIPPRKSYWDSQKLSMGSAPIKTEKGWLAIYNAVDRHDSSRYKIGAMLLDLNDPHKVIARSREPLLSPDEWYENEGKPGIAYPGGAVEIDGLLYVYYGGGDRVSCVATIPTSQLLDALLNDQPPNLNLHYVRS